MNQQIPQWGNWVQMPDSDSPQCTSLWDPGCCRLNVCVSPTPNSYIQILTPNVMVLGGGSFERWLCPEGGAFMYGVSAHIKEIPQSSLAPSIMWGHSRKTAICKKKKKKKMAICELNSKPSADIESASALILDLTTSRAMRNKCLLFKPPATIFIIAACED